LGWGRDDNASKETEEALAVRQDAATAQASVASRVVRRSMGRVVLVEGEAVNTLNTWPQKKKPPRKRTQPRRKPVEPGSKAAWLEFWSGK
jgi:hypothetical protein